MKNLKAENPCNMDLLSGGGAELALASGESSARRANRALAASASGGV